jgi:iron complex outermembrane receptor protein
VLEISEATPLEIVLEEIGIEIDDLLIVGSRFVPRTIIDSPVPVDNIKAEELVQTGQLTFDKMLTYAVPAFNSTQQTISDATAHFDPADLRGLGPSRTLVLVNGKRKTLPPWSSSTTPRAKAKSAWI